MISVVQWAVGSECEWGKVRSMCWRFDLVLSMYGSIPHCYIFFLLYYLVDCWTRTYISYISHISLTKPAAKIRHKKLSWKCQYIRYFPTFTQPSIHLVTILYSFLATSVRPQTAVGSISYVSQIPALVTVVSVLLEMSFAGRGFSLFLPCVYPHIFIMSSVAPVLYIVLDHTIRPGSLDSSFSSTNGLELRSVDTHRSAIKGQRDAHSICFFPSIDRLFHVSVVCLLSVSASAVSTVAPYFNL